MKAVCFFTNKGGVGKTTLLCNLAGYLAKEKGLRIAVVDADPQANATQYMFEDEFIEDVYDLESAETIYDYVRPVTQGKGFQQNLHLQRSESFKVDVVLGDPRLALVEDFLAADWGASGVRSLRSTYVFRQMLTHLSNYDYVFFDMGPSLGSINRAALIASDYFVIPISIDIFSVRAVTNISEWLSKWVKLLQQKLEFVDDPEDLEVDDIDLRLRLLGHVNQQYTAKRNSKGERRAVRAYEKIMADIPKTIAKSNLMQAKPSPESGYKLGEIPNLHSLIPMSQFSHKPIFALKATDGVVGAHFAKVAESKEIFQAIADRFIENINDLS
ncbi:MAG: ParA family protein [Sphingomonadaceae bacterium]|nr:ParA family protein [Sphingomonadaceae bacterium]